MSVHSMTAFARESCSAPCTIVVELRSVNQRYLDCHFRIPEGLRALEPKFREALGQRLKRGKIDCQLRVLGGEGQGALTLDEGRLDEVVRMLATVRERAPQFAQPDALGVLAFPGVCISEQADEDTLQKTALELFAAALNALVENRRREGDQLDRFIRQRLDSIDAIVAALRDALPELRQQQEARLRARLAELAAEVDEARLEQELVYLAQKGDVEEELDRLQAHVVEARRILDQGGPCGRRLDFLMQEFNREANTLSSKSSASNTTQNAVELKVLIEQMREQVQNIE
jgi:uncharacterized protein (TIGR00255 family)